MKKTLSAILGLLMLAMVLSVGISADGWSDEVMCNAAYGTPVIDGNVADWAKAESLKITLDDPVVNKYGMYQGNWQDAGKRDSKDFATDIRYMWDEDNLYIYEKRVDDDVLLTGSSDKPWASADGNLIFLMVGDCGSEINAEGWSHHIFYIAGNGNGGEGGQASVRINNRKAKSSKTVKYDDIKIASKKTSDGWVTEMAIPWSIFQKEVPGFKPSAHTVIGMSCVPIDCDDSGNDFSQLCWYNQASSQKIAEGFDYGGWAALKLAAPAAVATEPKSPATADAGILSAAILLSASAAVTARIKKH